VSLLVVAGLITFAGLLSLLVPPRTPPARGPTDPG
jgi:hypothetical protein